MTVPAPDNAPLSSVPPAPQPDADSVPPAPPAPPTAPSQDAPKEPKEWSKNKKAAHRDKLSGQVADLLHLLRDLGDEVHDGLFEGSLKNYDPKDADELHELMREYRDKLKKLRQAHPVKENNTSRKTGNGKQSGKASPKSGKKKSADDEPSGFQKFVNLFRTDRD